MNRIELRVILVHMNEELAVKLSDLRAAAEAMRSGTAAIRASVDAARGEISALAAHINPQVTPSFSQLVYSGRLVELTDTLGRLALQLMRTADDVDSAARWQGPPLGILWDRIGSRVRVGASAERADPALASYTLGSYISPANRPLYDTLLDDQTALANERATIAELVDARERAANDSATLRDRLRVYGETNIASVPRVQVLDRQIAEYDRDIRAGEGRVEALESRIDSATRRLIAVNPADSADVYLIRQLEGGESAPYVLSNTRDCVNYIASRVPIPGELAANAHLWDQRAAEYPQFGIRTGDSPLPGAILVMEADHPYADDRYGHVMLVERIDSAGGVWITDNNHSTPTRLSDLTSVTTGEKVKYLYLPWFTKA